VSLLAAAFLAGLATLAVPLWLHRMNERSPAERDVSSLMLMREAEEPVRTRRTLAHKLLLALRLAALAAVTLAFAQPVFEAATVAPEDTRTPAKLVVIDGSFSMRRDDAFPRALEIAGDLVADSPESHVVLAGERLSLVRDLGAAAPGWSRFDFTGLPERLDAVLATLEDDRQREVHVVSDFQETAVPDRFNALVEGVAWPFVLHRVGADADNWTIDAVDIRDGRLEAQISGYGERRSLDVSLRRDGVEADRLRLTTDPDAPGRATFEIPPAPRQAVRWEVELHASDAIAEDNVFRIVQPAADTNTVALLGATAPNAASAPAETTSLTFLTAALNAVGIQPVPVDADAPWPQSLDAIAVVDPGELPLPLVRRLERYLDGGGGVLVVVGPRTQRHGVLPIDGATLAGNVAGGVQRVVVVDPSHPVARTSWRGVEVERSLAPQAWAGETLLALAPTAGAVRRAETETPLVVEQRFGKGRLLVLLTALDRDWSSLVLRPAFVGFVREAVGYLAHNLPLAALAGEGVAVDVASVQLFDAADRRVLALDNTVGRPVVRIPRPGFYTVRTPGREGSIAVNVDPRESDLRGVTTEFLERWQEATRSGANATNVGGVGAGGGGSPEDETDWHPLAPWLLVFAAALLILESMAANIGRIKVPWGLPRPGRTTT